MVAKVLGKTGAPIKVQEMMYKEELHVVLLYKIKILVMKDKKVTVIEGFHHKIDRNIVGTTAR